MAINFKGDVSVKHTKLFLVLLLSLTALVAGCSSSGEETSGNDDSSGETDIKMQIVWGTDSGRGEAIQTIVDEFEKENEDINVELVSTTQNNQKLLTQVLSGQAPEVLQVPYREVRNLASEGAFMDLTDEFSDDAENFYDELVNLGTVNDKLYGFPWLGHTIQLVYNKTMFEEAGIDGPPENWDELYETAKKLTKDTDGDGKIDQYGLGLVGKQHPDVAWLTNMFVNQAGGEIVKESGDGYKVALNSPEGKEALKFYKKLVNEVAPPDTGNKDGGGVMADFRNEVVAMEFQGPWGITDIWKNGNPFEVAAAPVPAGPEGRAADLGPYMLSIPDTVSGDKAEASKKLIEFLGSKKAQEMIMLGEKGDDGEYYPFRVPMRKDLADSDYFQEHPEFLVFIEGLKYPSISSPVEAWARVEQEVYQSQLNQMVTGEKSVEEALETVEEKGNKILDSK
ncbi:ABC transporter substrate-binding protein [Halobacillus yeomjeoni]|uniref:ABC transporter substrate-binding protein n=1 Tax=Halobacillus yeomjeoni TaxID=311194 RepID=UPI001CD2A63B|nr:ABC transporter substrate-binding protein [Halobacillus yeomjeoni]MCA0984745.1 ABC transporter substrate-binding protein [Halobacillus yeomjeoni]